MKYCDTKISAFTVPAKAAVLNMVQFNGKFGCTYCQNPGKNIKQGQHIYQPSDSHVLRTELQMKQWPSKAEVSHKRVFGVKGLSVPSGSVNIPFGAPIDYMHAVLEGVVKTLLKVWFNSKNHSIAIHI